MTAALRRLAPVLLAVLALAGCGGVDMEQARVCRDLIPAFEDDPARVAVAAEETDPADPRRVVIRYTDGGGAERWIACRFAGRLTGSGRTELVAVATDRTGTLTPIQMAMLRIWRDLPAGRAGAWGGAAEWQPPPAWLYLLQQSLNLLVPGCFYGLLAVGYALVYRIVGRINLAFGALCTIGAFVTVIAMTLFGMVGAYGTAGALIVALLLAAAVTAAYGWTTERLVFRPLRDARSQAPLIATIGLAIFLEEFIRLSQGARDRWLVPIFRTPVRIAGTESFPVQMLVSQLLILGLAGIAYLVLWSVLARTDFGRAQRACADDARTAALMGVDVGRTVGLTFALGGAYAAVAGFLLAQYYGGVNFHTGWLVGFKALVAAVVGGLGSVAGAAIGGFLIAAVETFWSGYVSLATRDVAVFALLALFLIFRPRGLMGVPVSRGD